MSDSTAPPRIIRKKTGHFLEDFKGVFLQLIKNFRVKFSYFYFFFVDQFFKILIVFCLKFR